MPFAFRPMSVHSYGKPSSVKIAASDTRACASAGPIPFAPWGLGRLRWLGPGFLWMVSAAGSGELLFTPPFGSLAVRLALRLHAALGAGGDRPLKCRVLRDRGVHREELAPRAMGLTSGAPSLRARERGHPSASCHGEAFPRPSTG